MDAQRKALLAARTLTDSTDESQRLEFMLAALDAPEAQLAKCRELEQGNGLMRKQAAERLALLKENPNLSPEKRDLKEQFAATDPRKALTN